MLAMHTSLKILSLLACSLSPLAPAAGADVVFADFEGADYGAWSVTGAAFGDAPAHGTLPGQMHVEGFEGQGLVNSFRNGDASTGRLTSPEFRIERTAIRFLIGGGGHAGKTCLDLLVDGSVVRSAVGPNTQPGGSERLEAQGWDVSEFMGRSARLEIVDQASGGWGHINVDQIVFSDAKPPGKRVQPTRALTLDQAYLLFPVRTGARKHRVALLVDGVVVRDFEIELADDPEWFAHLDVRAWAGQRATVRVDWLPDDARALESIATSATIWHADEVYREPQRAQLHFSPRRGWTNDPNGLVFAEGEYHLYFQHNPYGWGWGNMHWGHARSRDLVHWLEQPIALYPPVHDDMAFSGSAVVDQANSSGWRQGREELLVAAFTSTGRGECIAYSNDRGRTWTEFAGNPVVQHSGRDPRLLWHEPTKRWVMCVYDELEGKRWIAFHSSPDLKSWSFESRIEGFYECPDLFALPLDGDPEHELWVLTAASSEYRVGHFDGHAFTPSSPMLTGQRGRGFYAAQTFSDEPRGRRVQLGWLQTATPGAAFNQAMSLPLELSLHTTADGPRLAWAPVDELEGLRAKSVHPAAFALESGAAEAVERALDGLSSDLLEVRASITLGSARCAGLRVRGVDVSYDPQSHELAVGDVHAPVALSGGVLSLVVYADRTCLEVFADGGLVYMPVNIAPKPEERSIQAFARGGSATFAALEAHELRSIWRP